MVENKEVFCKIQYMVSKGFFNGLDSCGIEYTIVKGCPLAYYKTGNPGSRLSSDIDIWYEYGMAWDGFTVRPRQH